MNALVEAKSEGKRHRALVHKQRPSYPVQIAGDAGQIMRLSNLYMGDSELICRVPLGRKHQPSAPGP